MIDIYLTLKVITMSQLKIKTSDYLFMLFKTATPSLEAVANIYYPHLSKSKILEKARNHEFPFCCFRMDNSQKSPYFVDILDLAFVIEERYKIHYEDFLNAAKKISTL